MTRNSEYVPMFNMEWTKPEAIRAQVDKIRRIGVGSATVPSDSINGINNVVFSTASDKVVKVTPLKTSQDIQLARRALRALKPSSTDSLGRSGKAEEHGVRLLIQDTVLQGHQVGVIAVWRWQMEELKH